MRFPRALGGAPERVQRPLRTRCQSRTLFAALGMARTCQSDVFEFAPRWRGGAYILQIIHKYQYLLQSTAHIELQRFDSRISKDQAKHRTTHTSLVSPADVDAKRKADSRSHGHTSPLTLKVLSLSDSQLSVVTIDPSNRGQRSNCFGGLV
ncbi:hypothetical protein BC834DRAFT_492063 [Gloeopeniophorella convolvens]|nr:hypothetical protein BC834DRAFT_492063 [Gloeopeniophorella convolvens]